MMAIDNMWLWWSPGNRWFYTLGVITIVFIIIPIFRRRRQSNSTISISQQQQHQLHSRVSSSSSSPPSEDKDEDVITDLDLKLLIHDLDDENNNKCSSVVDKSNNSLCYSVKCLKPRDGGPLKYLSTTVFKSCCSELLKDFYMDNIYRKEWDKTLIQHQQLQIKHSNGTEFGRTIKKFPLLTPREYILAWRLWEQGTDTYYCYSKECEHPLAPRQNKYVRVSLCRSGWRIRQVGTNSCEIKMVHQEDAGLNVEMAKLIFAKGIWSYVCKMDNALRKYTDIKRLQLKSTISAITLVQKVPLSLDSSTNNIAVNHPPQEEEDYSHKKVKVSRKPSKKFIANGLILVGGLICLAHGHTNFTAKATMAFALGKLKNRQTCLH